MRSLAILVLMSGTVIAAPRSYDFTTAPDGTVMARQAVATASGLQARSRTLYLNRFGATLYPGANDSRTQTSSIVTRQVAMAGWSASTAQWQEVVACMREIWAPFDVVVTDVDPGQTRHVEVLVGGSPEDLGLPPKIAGVAPMSTSCGIVEDAIVFAFPDNLHGVPQKICEVMSQEIGHSYGLDHELEAADPMTYLSYSGHRSFQDRTAACGETTARPCGVAGNSCRPDQNSVRLLLERLGAAGSDNSPPEVTITSPADGEIVVPGFAVVAQVLDNVGVDSVELYIDGRLVETQTVPPFAFTTEPALTAGDHQLRLEAADARGNVTSAERTVMLDAADEQDSQPLAGCSTNRTPSVILVLAVLGLVRRRRRPSRSR